MGCYIATLLPLPNDLGYRPEGVTRLTRCIIEGRAGWAGVRFPSASVNPTVSAEHSAVLLPPALTSCAWTVPSLPINSTITRHFIPLSRSAAASRLHTTPHV
jgi:hypothetical protein